MQIVQMILDILKLGFCFSLVSLGIFISYRILDIADLTAEGSFTLGGAVTAVLLVLAVNPVLATLCGILAGFLAGVVTGVLHTKLKISGLLSGIITMTALFSINMVILGLAPSVRSGSNGSLIVEKNESGYAAAVYLSQKNIDGVKIRTIFNSIFGFITNNNLRMAIIITILVILIVSIIYWFFGTEFGMSIRATGINPNMARAQGINTTVRIIIGLGISNALIASGGAIFAQIKLSADSTMGIGVLVIGLASIIIGEAIFGKRSFKNWLISVVLGSLIYYSIIEIATRLGLESHLQKLLYACIILIVLTVPLVFKKKKGAKKYGNA